MMVVIAYVEHDVYMQQDAGKRGKLDTYVRIKVMGVWTITNTRKHIAI